MIQFRTIDQDQSPPSVKAAMYAAETLWPEFVVEHGCVFLGWHAGSNPPPDNATATGWESFVNHTHMLDEFENAAEKIVGEDVIYKEDHPDFVAACELGQRIAWMWALKLKLDFPCERFRVYYTQYDNPIVRFHKVRDGEEHWLSDEGLQSATEPSFRNALIFDTAKMPFAIERVSKSIQ